MKTITMIAKGTSVLVGLCLLMGTPPASAQTGTIVALEGTATVIRQGTEIPAARGFSISEGDTVQAGAGSRVQFHLEDDSVFALPSNSALKIEQFSRGRQASGGTAIFALLKGGLRTVTGLIGKVKGDTYQVRTGLATIGVRGSAYSALLCADSCSAHGRFRSGLYVKAHGGTIIIRNSGGELRLRAGQSGFAAALDQAPVLVARSPLDEPDFATGLDLGIDFDTEVHPPRIEHEPPASPS